MTNGRTRIGGWQHGKGIGIRIVCIVATIGGIRIGCSNSSGTGAGPVAASAAQFVFGIAAAAAGRWSGGSVAAAAAILGNITTAVPGGLSLVAAVVRWLLFSGL